MFGKTLHLTRRENSSYFPTLRPFFVIWYYNSKFFLSHPVYDDDDDDDIFRDLYIICQYDEENWSAANKLSRMINLGN